MSSLLDVDDPRVTGESVRQIDEWPVTLVGVVHGHPASVHRVRHVIEDRDPALVALELPPLSISTYKQYSRDDEEPPASGGEMSAAIQSARTTRVLGIDGPSLGYFGELLRTLLTERPNVALTRTVLATLGSMTKSLIASRLPTNDTPPGNHASVDYAVGHGDTPTAQARDEQKQIRRARAFLGSLRQTSTRTALQVQTSTRERHMAAMLERHCKPRRSVAIVGVHHLEALATQLEGQGSIA